MTSNQKIIRRSLAMITTICFMFMLAGCTDIEYKYNIPKEGDCPADTTLRDDGTGIVDRDDGTGIVDRDGGFVSAYCEEAECPSGEWKDDPAIIDWHQNKGDYVIANRICLAETDVERE